MFDTTGSDAVLGEPPTLKLLCAPFDSFDDGGGNVMSQDEVVPLSDSDGGHVVFKETRINTVDLNRRGVGTVDADLLHVADDDLGRVDEYDQ